MDPTLSNLGQLAKQTQGLGNFALIKDGKASYGNGESWFMRELIDPKGKYQASPHIFDVWDFDTAHPMVADTKIERDFILPVESKSIVKALDPLAKALLRRVGQPYAIYDDNPLYKFGEKTKPR